jgi:hypothetical protein
MHQNNKIKINKITPKYTKFIDDYNKNKVNYNNVDLNNKNLK